MKFNSLHLLNTIFENEPNLKLMIITFEELRTLKDKLPHGSMERIANKLELDIQTVRNYFGASDFTQGGFVGAHYEQGIHGGIVKIEDDRIYKIANQLVGEMEHAPS